MIRNIVFDMGEVLYHFYPEEALYALPPEDRRILEGAIFRHPDWIRQDRGDVTEAELMELVRARVPERLRETADQFVRWYELTSPVDGVEEVARELHEAGYPLYLLSNAGEAFHRFRVRIPALRYFKGEFVPADYHLLKPHAEIYEKFTEVYGLAPAQCLFIDDYPPNIEGAKNCGWDGIVFRGDVAELRRELAERGILSH